MLERVIFIDVAAGVIVVLLWYFSFVHYNRRKAARVVKWIERAFDGNGEIAAVEWLSSSKFLLRLRLWPNLFRQTSISVQFLPRELPLSWLVARIKGQRETLTFTADLDCPPSFNLEVHNHRWCGRTRRRFPKTNENWTIERSGPFVITTRNDWQREITNMMHALMASRECDCATVSFSRSSPHFTATVPLESISPGAQSESNVFRAMKELAAGASASRF